MLLEYIIAMQSALNAQTYTVCQMSRHQEKKRHANDFSLRRTCYWHLLSAIGSCLAVNWQVGQLINFLFSCIASYSTIGSRLAVNWQVGRLISN
jgi:hypothetical protein